MSWLARSLANSLRIDDDDDDEQISDEPNPKPPPPPPPPHSNREQLEEQSQHDDDEDEDEDEDRSDNQGRGVKEDLSEFRETLTRQLWGVASFLAPAPSDLNRRESFGSGDISDEEASESVGVSGNYDDFSERNAAGMSDPLNCNLEVSNYLLFGSEDQIGEAVGITDEVLAFASNIAHHPETWLDFPLSEDEDMDDFDISDAQLEHALAVEHLTPRLAALRIELCPAHMSEAYFWKVYFVLLHSRLDKHDAELLSTAQSVSARKMWMKELQKRAEPEAEPDWYGRRTSYSKDRACSFHDDFDQASSDYSPSGNMSHRAFAFEPTTFSATEFETEKHAVESTEIHIIDKSVIEEEPEIKAEDKDVLAGSSYKVQVSNYAEEDDEDDWLKENSDLDGYSVNFEGNNEDVSFSDLEEDADFSGLTHSKIGSKGLETPTKTS